MRRLLLLLATSAILIAGCGEVDQSTTAENTNRDAKPWQGAQAAYMAPGWKAGNQGEWETQIRTRGQAQNEYPRTR
jgi:uncharacterized protein YceK